MRRVFWIPNCLFEMIHFEIQTVLFYYFRMSRQLSAQYDKAALQSAVDAVKSKSMGYIKASKVFNVPRPTIII